MKTRNTCSQLNLTYTDNLCENHNINSYQSRYFLSYTKETALNAAELCKRSGGYLASISNSYEMNVVVKFTATNAGDPILIGLHADSSVLADGYTSYYRNFFDGEVPTASKRCVGFEHNDNGDDAKWRYISCDEPSQFLCEGKRISCFLI